MNRCHILRIALLILTVILLGNALAISRDYQDSWILEGLEIPFILFVVIFALTFFSEEKESLLIGLAVLGRIAFLLIPNLKYVWFQGSAMDQHVQYNLADYVYHEGHISTFSSSVYVATPLMHILFSVFSIVLNVPVVDSMKYIPVLLSPIYPLLTYVIVKIMVEKMELSQKTTILRYALFISSLPFTAGQYVVSGTLFGILLAFLILSCLIIMLQKNDRRYWFVCTIFIFALAAAHSVTSIILTILLLAILVLQRVSYFRPKSYLRAAVVLMIALISLAWLMFPAYYSLEEISHEIFIAAPTGTTPSSEYVPSTFFELARANILAAVKTFMVYYGADLFLLILTFAGLVSMLKIGKKSNDAGKFLLLFSGLALILILIGTFLKLGPTRALSFEELLFPIFSGIAVFCISKKRLWIRPIIFASIMLLATLQLYGCQPLIPSANVVHKDLPASIPIGYVNEVNSVYQRQVVNFVLNHVVGRIASDALTGNQILSVAEYNLRTIKYNSSIAHLMRYYPIDKSEPPQQYDVFIIHLPGKSGILEEKVKNRTPNLILQTIYNSGIVYTNGESFVLSNQTIDTNP